MSLRSVPSITKFFTFQDPMHRLRTDLMVIVITTIMISDYHDNDYNDSGI